MCQNVPCGIHLHQTITHCFKLNSNLTGQPTLYLATRPGHCVELESQSGAPGRRNVPWLGQWALGQDTQGRHQNWGSWRQLHSALAEGCLLPLTAPKRWPQEIWEGHGVSNYGPSSLSAGLTSTGFTSKGFTSTDSTNAKFRCIVGWIWGCRNPRIQQANCVHQLCHVM